MKMKTQKTRAIKAFLKLWIIVLLLIGSSCSKEKNPVYQLRLDGVCKNEYSSEQQTVSYKLKNVVLFSQDEIAGRYYFRNGDQPCDPESESYDMMLRTHDDGSVTGVLYLERFADIQDPYTTAEVFFDGQSGNRGDNLECNGSFHYGLPTSGQPLGASTGPYYHYYVSGTFEMKMK